MLETGRIRSPQWRWSDGDSTRFFAGHPEVKRVLSIDNDSENFSGYPSSREYCLKYIPPDQLHKVEFLDGDCDHDQRTRSENAS